MSDSTETDETSSATNVVTFPVTPPRTPPDRTLAQRWKHEELFEKGYVGVPTSFLQTYAELVPHVAGGEALFVIHVMQFKWDSRRPFPSYRAIAKQMGVSDKQVRRHAASLETKGYIRRVSRIGMTNEYDFGPLFDAVLAAIEKKKAKKAANAVGA